MPTWVGLLRGINVGGHGKLPMATLVQNMEAAGCTAVRTYIQSGNTVFTHRGRTPGPIAAAISAAISFAPRVMVLSAEAFRAAAAACPFPTDNGKALDVFFLAEPPTAEAIASLEPLREGTEQYAVIGQTLYFYVPDDRASAKIAIKAEKKLGVAATARNWNTVAKLLTMLP